MLPKAIVHIGPMKTGSTSIQHWLFHKADLLEGHGVHVVQSLGRNMSRLSTLALAQVLEKPPIASDLERLERAKEEVAALPNTVHTIVISGEMLGQQLHKPREVRTLKTMLDEFCGSYQIITYLRRQDELSVSRYSTALRRGERSARPLSRAIDYEAMLSAWAKVFGRGAITARVFERDALLDGDVVRDFADAAGLPFEPLEGGSLNQNSSLRAEAQTFLLDLAQRARELGVDGPLAEYSRMDELNRVLDRQFTGKGVRPARPDALTFYDAVRASNEEVRRSWFPERETLFSEDFSSYPESEPTPPSAEQVLEVAMTVLANLVIGRHERPKPDDDMKARRVLSERMRERRRMRGAGERGKRPAPG